MDTAGYDRALEELRTRVATLPPGARAALEALLAETEARQREIAAAHAAAVAAARRLDAATAGFHAAAAHAAGDSSRALDGIQDALIDLECVALDLESRGRKRGGPR